MTTNTTNEENTPLMESNTTEEVGCRTTINPTVSPSVSMNTMSATLNSLRKSSAPLLPPMLQPRSDSLPSSSEAMAKLAQLRRPKMIADKILPKFSTNPSEATLPAPSARFPISPTIDFATPLFPHRHSRPNSPSAAGKLPYVPRSRIANIRRESDCSPLESEVAHERYVKAAVQVSTGFEDFSLADKPLDSERKRPHSFADPISVSILGSGFSASTGSSPNRSIVDATKQCYSPATQTLVRGNVSYSPSPSPTPSTASPKSQRVMRSMSPIVTRQISKRRYTNSSTGFCDSDNDGPLSSKRQCTAPEQSSKASCSSPLVREITFGFDGTPSNGTPSDNSTSNNTLRPASPISECSTSSSIVSMVRPNKFLLEGVILPSSSNSSPMRNDNLESDDFSKESGSTTLSSRDQTPFDEVVGSDDFPPPSTTPTGLVRSVGSMSPYVNRFMLPPSPLASTKPRDEC